LLGEKGGDISSLFKDAYLNHNTLADATRYLVHSLFADHGLVCLDADSPDLKRLFIPVLQQDLMRQNVEKAVSESIQKLGDYKLPVNPRKINVFYLTNEGRNRIVDEEGYFQVKEIGKKWKVDELLAELEANPERFSPNVVLRPIYQEVILPNLVYIGGTNEIAYWLELKQAFDLLHVFFPQLLVRDSALWLGKKMNKDIQALGLSYQDILLSAKELKDKFYETHQLAHPAEETLDEIMEGYNGLREKLQDIDKATVAGIVKSMNEHFKELKKWKSQVKAHIAMQEEKNLQKLDKIHSTLFPNEEFQERYENFIGYYLKYGQDFFNQLIDEFGPAEGNLHIFAEED
jgi:bacillithiol biosynthesis cysteine-adding enzyme BshC